MILRITFIKLIFFAEKHLSFVDIYELPTGEGHVDPSSQANSLKAR